MITELRASNFRSLGRDVRLKLDNLTALVGPNGSGKSNAVDLLRFVSECVQIGLEGAISRRGGIGRVRRFSSGAPFDLNVQLTIKNTSFSGIYQFTLGGDRTEDYRVKSEVASVTGESGSHRIHRVEQEWRDMPSDLRPEVDPMSLVLPLVAGDTRFAPLARVLRSIAVYSIFPDTLRTPHVYDATRPMDQHGSNWVSILKDMKQGDWKPDLVEALNKLAGDVEDIKVQQAGGYLTVTFKHHHRAGLKKKLKWLDAAQESDGTLRVAGIITALKQEPRPALIGIEEPELTVHPGALPLIYDYIAEASNYSQIVVTTHSPDLLDRFDADHVRVVARRGSETTIAPMQESQRQAVTAGLMTLGEVLRVEGFQQELGFPQD